MKHSRLVLSSLAFAISSLATAQTYSYDYKYPVNWIVANCVESIKIEGTIHTHGSTTFSDTGYSNSYSHNFSGVKGEGLVTKKRYIVQENYQDSWIQEWSPITEYHQSVQRYMRIVPQGGGEARRVRYQSGYGWVNGQFYSNFNFSDNCYE